MEQTKEDVTPKGFNVVDIVLCGIGFGLLVASSLWHIDSYTGGAGAVALGAGLMGLISRSG